MMEPKLSPVLFVAEGLFMYLPSGQVIQTLIRLGESFIHSDCGYRLNSKALPGISSQLHFTLSVYPITNNQKIEL